MPVVGRITWRSVMAMSCIMETTGTLNQIWLVIVPCGSMTCTAMSSLQSPLASYENAMSSPVRGSCLGWAVNDVAASLPLKSHSPSVSSVSG
jgi:hypothetical protein